MSKRKLYTVKSGYSKETVQALEDLLLAARAGEIVGFSYAALHKTRTNDSVGTAGLSTIALDRTSFLLQKLNFHLVLSD